MDKQMRRRQVWVQERLVRLYLRLNGYFVNTLIIHSSDWGLNRAQVDAFGVRHPNHSQPDRLIKEDPIVDVRQGRTDLVFCEVKSANQPKKFNKGLQEAEALRLLLMWSGLFSEAEAADLAPQLAAAVSLEKPLPDRPPEVMGPRSIRVRGLIFAPENEEQVGEPRFYIKGSAIMGYAWQCFNPTQRRDTCSTRYDFDGWDEYSDIVRYFKDRGQTGQGDPGSILDLYAALLKV
jgi:hypothetical protein